MPEAFAGFRRTAVSGVPVLWLPDSRFKTFRVNLTARRPLDQRAAARSLLPSLLMQGTARYPNRPALARRMESLYGAMVAPGTSKRGETHWLRFALDCVAGDFLPDRPDQIGEGLEFLAEYLARPRLEGGGFPAGVFARERTQAANDARAVFDDRAGFAAQQAISIACEGEPMAIPEHGGVAAIEALDRFAPEAARLDFLRHGELLVTAMGSLPDDAVLLGQVGAFLAHLPEGDAQPIGPPVARAIVEPRRAVERVDDLQQSKLVLIFRIPWSDDSRTWSARALFTSMLGGGPHSRLFREIREAGSLAYYTHAVLDRHKGLLTVHVGLDEKNAERAEAVVLSQLGELRAGSFSQQELDTARAGILSAIAAIRDGIRSHMQFVEDQFFLGLDRTPEDLFATYQTLDAAAVAAGAEGVTLDFAYLLAPRNGGNQT